MRGELWVLFLSVCLGIFQILVAASAATRVRGLAWNLSSRDADAKALDGHAGRLDRALQNFKETFPLFAVAVLLLAATQNFGSISLIGAWTYLLCRIVYIPLYVFDVIGVRTTVWGFSMLGLSLVLVQVLL